MAKRFVVEVVLQVLLQLTGILVAQRRVGVQAAAQDRPDRRRNGTIVPGNRDRRRGARLQYPGNKNNPCRHRLAQQVRAAQAAGMADGP